MVSSVRSDNSSSGSGVRRSAKERFVAFGTYPNEMQAGIVRSALNDAGIAAFVQPSDAMPGGVAIFGTLTLVPSSVMVLPNDLARAAIALEEASIDVSAEELEAAALAESGDEAGHIQPETGEAQTVWTGSRQLFKNKRSLMRIVGWAAVIAVLLYLLGSVVWGVAFLIQEVFLSGGDVPTMVAF